MRSSPRITRAQLADETRPRPDILPEQLGIRLKASVGQDDGIGRVVALASALLDRDTNHGFIPDHELERVGAVQDVASCPAEMIRQRSQHHIGPAALPDQS